jgi:hypothetical protein
MVQPLQLPSLAFERGAVVTIPLDQVADLPNGYAELVGEVANLVVIKGRHVISVLFADVDLVVCPHAFLTMVA